MSGLYVFNVAGNNGFVVVSNDDRATSILGYADSGCFDETAMPENMQAWLQGYADELATLDNSGLAATQSTGGSHYYAAPGVKTAIAPLIQTLWNQDSPYNDLCPVYSGTNKSATGCVATAMAQAMYFTETQAGNSSTTTTAEIPGYTPSGLSAQPAIPAGTPLSWSNMQLTYPAVGTEAQKSAANTAVAQLMYYCGVSLEMAYGQQSGTQTSKVASSLRNYFGYDATTTFVIRSSYTYLDWINLMYYELSQGRPVVYGGQSTGGGHCFICDGYQSEDYFHINWGWGGISNGYFKLSALSPNEQGIGGSTSTDGYHYGQEAVIGIQKAGGSGTLSDIVGNAINLSIKSISVSPESIVLGETAHVTINVTNNSSATYDGDLWIGSNALNCMLIGKTFVIAAGETKDCVLDYTPSGFTGTVDLLVFIPATNGEFSTSDAYPQTRLTVTNGGSGSATNNVELSLAIDVLSPNEATGGTYNFGDGVLTPGYNLYGNALKARATLTNETDTDYAGSFVWLLNPNGESAIVHFVDVAVPAGGSKSVEFEENNLNDAKQYILSTGYVKNNTYSLSRNGVYTLKPAVITYAADGTRTIVKPTTSYTVPDGVLTVDLSGTGVTAVTGNGEPNLLYVLASSDTEPAGLSNVVRYDGSTYTASAITLTDGHDYYSPFDIEAGSVEFLYQHATPADGTKGWNTIVLPFGATSVTADGTPIDWFHSSSDTGKNFWLKEFTGDSESTVNFGFVAGNMQANVPYIVAFPGNKWGSEWDMSTKTIKFVGENVTLSKSTVNTTVTGNYYRLMSSYVSTDTPDIYCLNADGNRFVLQATGGSKPFRAYFKADSFDREVTSLSIGPDGGSTTAIASMGMPAATASGAVYNLNGQRVAQPVKGIYIHNGKKIIKK